ncbi:MAG: hypothetical protein C0615_05390 [Desulfuromonas sp.]|nr:MAG: hypothetical protein C0615_05390 [Desulfuromonas sp.]
MRSIIESIGISFDLFILLLVFVAVAFAVGAMVWMMVSRDNYQQRLKKVTSEGKRQPEILKDQGKSLIESEQQAGFFDLLLSPLHRFALPEEESIQRRLRLRLVQAGFRSKRAFRIYLGAKVLLTLLFPGLYFLSLFVKTFNSQTLLIMASLAAAGLFLPNLIVNLLGSARKSRILRALPDALDLMVICVEAGLGLDMTFKRVGDEIRPLCSDLSEEFHLVNREVRAGKSRQDAFNQMSLRTGVNEVHSLMTVLTQTSRFGTSIAKALRVHADAMRVRRRLAAEERAAKSAVKLVFPLVVFVFPAIFVVLVGPAAIRIMKTVIPAFGGG